MQNTDLIYPMAALVFLSFFIMFTMLFLRIKAVRSRKISPGYFKLNKGGDVPDNITAVSQNYNNLLEMPILFYAVCMIYLVMNQNIEHFTIYAWVYVGFRYMHSYIHITYNHVLHRLFAFAASCIVLMSMWIKLIMVVS